MAQTISNILVGGATVEVSDYVTAGGAGTFSEVGHTESPLELARTYEDYEATSEQIGGIERRIPVITRETVKFSMKEATLENLRIASRLASGDLTGTPPNLTLVMGDAQEQYHQLRFVGVGLGSGGVRTVTAWKAIVTEVEPVRMAKGEPQLFAVTAELMRDSSLATADKFKKVVDS